MTTCVLCSASLEANSRLIWQKDGFDIVRCASCGLIFRADSPDEGALREIYDEHYFRDDPQAPDRHGYADYLADAPLHRANARRRLAFLSSLGSHSGRLIDVGSAAGFFVDEARRAGWEASGVDVSEPMVFWARDELGVPGQAVAFSQAEVPDDLDVVTMWDYIEHSIDPRADLMKAAEHLHPGGLLALSTGDVGALTARLAGRRWHLLTPEHHNFFFDRKRLCRLLELTGFEIVDVKHRAAVYSGGHVLYKLSALTSVPTLRDWATRVGRSRLGDMCVPLNLFDIMTVVARRTGSASAAAAA